jgi:hypothetical protein
MFDAQIVRYGQNMANHRLIQERGLFAVGGYRYKEFKNCCDYEYVMRLIRANCRVGHIPVYIVNYRYHEHGQSADLRVRANI